MTSHANNDPSVVFFWDIRRQSLNKCDQSSMIVMWRYDQIFWSVMLHSTSFTTSDALILLGGSDWYSFGSKQNKIS